MNTQAYVLSMNGLVKKICTAQCDREHCARAHPNASGSKVSHPKWCLRGPIAGCDRAACPFNHFLSEADFVAYRSGDLNWATNNAGLCFKYQDRINARVEKNRDVLPTLGEFISV